MHKIISYFSSRHLLTNFIVIGIFIGALLSWNKIKKEELPNFDLNFIIVKTVYPGATPADVERLVTRELEKEIKSVDGIYEINSTSTVGISSIRIEFEAGFKDIDESIMEIRNIVSSTSLPSEVRDLPKVRVFKVSKKAVIDVGLFHKKIHLLTTKTRMQLQKYAIALENRLLSSKHISEVSRKGYLTEELQIFLLPYKLKQYSIPINDVISIIQKHNIRKPLGSIHDSKDTKITIQAEIDSINKLKNLVIRGGFDTPIIRLGQIAIIKKGFERNTTIRKVNGKEGVQFNVYKRSASDILTATDKARQIVNDFNKNILKNTNFKVILLDDESRDVRNRLSLIGWNGLIGFILILVMLFLFMDFKSGFWVAMGIPFTFSMTFIVLTLMDYSINNITLAAIIIVMGMIVDDAIVVSENIAREKENGIPDEKAVVTGTTKVIKPVIASIITTCAAFIPLLLFTGRFGRMLVFIPPVIFIMLFASLFESALILPAHLNLKIHSWIKTFFTFGLNKFVKNNKTKPLIKKQHWFYKIENSYGKLLTKILKFRFIILFAFIAILVGSFFVFKNNFKFVMFPREETTQLNIIGRISRNAGRIRTAHAAHKFEKIIEKDLGKTVVGFRTVVAASRRGGSADQNKFFIRVEIVPKDQRKISTRGLKRKWKKQFKKIKEIKRFYIAKSRFGHSSGSAIEIVIQENNNKTRINVANYLKKELTKIKSLKNIEIEEPLHSPEYQIDIKRDLITRLGINPQDISTAMRTILEGTILYELPKGDEEINVRVNFRDKDKQNIFQILNIPVKNSEQYLVPLNKVTSVRKLNMPNAIERKDYKRTTKIYADLRQNSTLTPIDIGNLLEKKVFPIIEKKYPTSILSFGGEIKDTRESQGNLFLSVMLVIFFIYIILSLLFNSMTKPIIIMMTIPFGAAGIIFAFWAHGIHLFGLFAAIGGLGLAGVVVNDSIVMLDKLETLNNRARKIPFKEIAKISQTRLRAVLLTTFTTVAGVMPTAYGIAGYDSMLAEMMLGLSWGLLFGTFITLIYVPCAYSILNDIHYKFKTNKRKRA